MKPLCLVKCWYYIILSGTSSFLEFMMAYSSSSSSQFLPTLLSSQDVGLNTDAVVCHFSSSSCRSGGQTKSLAFPLHHHSSRDSSHGQSLSSNHHSLRSIQVFSISSNKHPGKESVNYCIDYLVSGLHQCTVVYPDGSRHIVLWAEK